MAISPFEVNGMMGRTQDFTAYKHQEVNKPTVDQSVFQSQEEKKVQNKSEKVQTSQESETQRQKKDAREKGSNEYAGDGGRKRRQQQEKPEDKLLKGGRPGSRFECSI